MTARDLARRAKRLLRGQQAPAPAAAPPPKPSIGPLRTCLMIGVGGMATQWLKILNGPFAGRVKIVGLCDVDRELLGRIGEPLGLGEDALFTDYHEACSAVEADFACIVLPPEHHGPAAIAAMESGKAVLCEKPIAHDLETAKEMVRTSRRTGRPCAIIQNYRYEPNKQELVRIRDAGELGRLQHVVARYAADYREPLSWGKAWRHEMPFSLILEACVHHLDMLRYLSGGDCEILTGFGWNPEWSSFQHHSSGIYLMRMSNGVHACYEGNSSAAGITNSWFDEYYRAEFEGGTVELTGPDRVVVHRVGQAPHAYAAPRMERMRHAWQIEEFLDWVDGGSPSATRIEDNIKTFAQVVAAMDTTTDGQPRKISDYLGDLDL